MKLKDWRRLRGFSQKRAADCIGTSQSVIAKCELGRVPSPAQMKKIIIGTDGAVTANDFYDIADLISRQLRLDGGPVEGCAA